MSNKTFLIADGEKIRKMRKALGLTQMQLAKRAKIAVQTLQRIEQNAQVGDNHSRPTTVQRLAKQLGCDQSEIRDSEMESFDD